MKTWVDFYKQRLNDNYFNHVKSKYKPFIDEVESSIKNGDHVVELGCGMANITRALIEFDLIADYSIMDFEIGMLELSDLNLKNSDYFVTICKGNILLNCLNGDVAHSHGVLEHFSDYEIRRIISLQKANYSKLIHYVPSNKYETPSFGDERLLSVDKWRDICKPDEIIKFNNGHDLILKWG